MVNFNGGDIDVTQELEAEEEDIEVQKDEFGVLSHEEQRNMEGMLEENNGRLKRVSR